MLVCRLSRRVRHRRRETRQSFGLSGTSSNLSTKDRSVIEEIKVLREMIGGKRLRFTDEQRRRLALRAKALSACTLKDLGPFVTPDTLCRWFRKYAGAKYDSSEQR